MLDIDIADLKRISELIYQKHNYDFRNYAMSSLKRRVLRIMELKKLSVDTLLKKLTDTPAFINEFLDELAVNVTEMFRDPSYWRVMRGGDHSGHHAQPQTVQNMACGLFLRRGSALPCASC